MNKIKDLEDKIIKARAAYYNTGAPVVSDKVFDAWVDELAELDPKNSAIINIGSEPVSNWEKYNHIVPLGSLNKVQTHEEYLKWHNKYIAQDDKVFLTLKLDGLSVSLIYENGLLVKAATRGSGSCGELITYNVAKMIGIPLKLNKKINATIRGEILLSKNNHNIYFKEYSNPRNAASGISRRYDGTGSDKLTVFAYQILTDDLNIDTQFDQFKVLEQLNFSVPTHYILNSVQEVCDLKEKYQASERENYEFELDGLVAHNNDLHKQAAFGFNNNRPYASIAIKFDSVAKEGFISDIKIQVGNSGRLTPVAVFSPKIQLMGAEVERASLHNFSNIADLGIDIGATVLVCRSNEVIPFIEEVIQSTGTIFKTPSNCPECGSPIIEKGEYVQCPNVESCPAQQAGRIKNWIKELNILEWGDSLIERLVESKKVNNIADLYKLTTDDLAGLERMGQKSAQKCHALLWTSKEIPLEIFLGALSIPLIGQSTIKLIMESGSDTLDKILQLDVVDFEKVPGVGPVKAKSLADGLKSNKQLISNLLSNGIKIREKINGKFSSKSFVFTGTMVNKRNVLEDMVKNNGGIVKSSVSKGVDYLVIADPNSTSSKAVSARKFGIKLISEEEFLGMVN